MKVKTNEKIPLKTVKEIFQKYGKNYSEEQLIAIRDFLYELAEIDYTIFIYLDEREAQFRAGITEIKEPEYKNAA